MKFIVTNIISDTVFTAVLIFSTGVVPVRATVPVIQNLDEACPSQEIITNEINRLKMKRMDLITNVVTLTLDKNRTSQ